ncbi:MAG TPA: 2-oxoacid:acceptor oxidoreductase family protein [Spirochaetota bacterium]|nr:2-oxoacid:acceptor oxidoreductase family protein [Spirochaetota bacterium]
MLIKMIFAGSGGQGVLTAGNILGNAAMIDDYHVTYLPSYGAAMRGGTANCTICISDEEIASPVASSPDFVVSLNKPSTVKFANRLESGGQLIYNSSLIDTFPYRGDIDLYPVPANAIAASLGNERSANMVALGAFIKIVRVIKLETVEKSIAQLMGSKAKLVETSCTALRAGFDGFPFSNGQA